MNILLLRPSLGVRALRLRPTSHTHSPRRPLRYKSSTATTEAAARPNGPSAQVKKSVEAAGDPSKPVDVPIPLWYHRLGPVTSFFGWFNRTQSRRPLLVQFCTSITIYLFGDLFAQRIGGEEYDPKRTARHLVVGGVASLPGYKWFIWLGNHFNYPSKLLSILTKVVVQQIVFTPIFNTYFFAMQALLSGASPEAIVDRVTKAVPESIKNSVKLWPAVTALTFWFIQPQYRFMTTGVVAVFWQSYLSWLNQREAAKVANRAVTPVEAPAR